jgi:hypothetical protein
MLLEALVYLMTFYMNKGGSKGHQFKTLTTDKLLIQTKKKKKNADVFSMILIVPVSNQAVIQLPRYL